MIRETPTTAWRIAQAVRAGELAAVDVLEACAARIDADNDRLNALVALRLEAARSEARAIDDAIRQGAQVGPLAGVPFTVKDVLATADLPTTCGSRTMHGRRQRLDATVVQRIRRAGGILVGKTNCPEFAFGVDTVNPLHGRTLNPIGDFIPGGSSGGEASAVAAGFSALGVGTDFGGSVRWPAQCAGLVGLRPTVGRVPGTGTLPAPSDEEPFTVNAMTLQGRLQVVGLLAPSVDDVAAGLAVVAGADGFDAGAVSFPPPDPVSDPPDRSPLAVSYGYDVGDHQADPAVRAAVDWAVAVLRDTGARTSAPLPQELHLAADLYSSMRAAEALSDIAAVVDDRLDDVSPMIRQLLSSATPLPEREVAALWAKRDRLRGALLERLAGDRVLVLPIATSLPPWTRDRVPVDRLELLTPSRAVTLFGLPSLSVPCPPAADGRPVSVQVVAPPFREDLVLAVGRRLEQARKGGRRAGA